MSPTANSSRASCTSPADCRMKWNRSKRDSEWSSTTSLLDGPDSRSDNGSPLHLAGPSNKGWLEALEKLEAALLDIQAAATDAQV